MPGRAAVPDPAEVLAAVGLPAPDQHHRMAGFDAVVWQVTTAGRTLAVRLLRRGHASGRECAAVRLAAVLGLPVPHIVAEGSWAGRTVVVSTWCAGTPVGERMVAEPDSLGALAGRFGAAQAALHDAPLPAENAVQSLGPSAILQQDVDPMIRAALAAAPPAPVALVHLDFQPFNVLDDGQRVTGIVDWANAAVADPRYDVARTRAIMAVAPAIRPALVPLLDAFLAAWSRGYTAVRPMPDDDELAPFLAWAGATQIGDWAGRVAGGETGPEIETAARDFAQFWRTRL